ncbi:MAG: hypothetical protein CME71_08770 [Halobacteriovorax sp.]|nr:hypothetical protein [Halobacteriovorax sp.]
MSKTKIAIVVATNPSIWQSCRIITPNIDKCYRHIRDQSKGSIELEYFNYHNDQSELELLDEVKRTAAWSPDIVVFMDHQPHPLAFLNHFKDLAKATVRYVFHVYGDFTLFTTDWLSVGHMIPNSKCQFIAASNKQVELISSFMENPDNVFYCPFPVDTERFYFDPKQRKQARKDLGIKDDEHVFLYTGRLSPQKRTVDLIRGFVSAFKDSKKPPLLIFAGGFDHLGVPYLGQYLSSNEYQSNIYQLLSNLPENLKARVHYIGSLDPEELVSYYMAGDTFVSLSLHNDEDYGMSPIESLLCGSRAILTDWAGYGSFAIDREFCELVPVEFTNHRLTYDLKLFIDLLKRNEQAGIQNDEVRKQIHDVYTEKFSIAAGCKIIENIILKGSCDFKGFSNKLMTMSALFKSNPYSPFGHSRLPLAYNSFYEDIYAPYFRPTQK